MADDAPRKAARRDHDIEIAAAEALFHDDPVKKPTKQSDRPAVAANPDDVFALAEPSSLEIPTSLSPGAAPKTSGAAPAVEDESRLDPSDLVEEIWSRPGEWGGTLILVGAWLAAVFLVFFFCWEQELYGPGFLALLVGGVVAVVLSYPIVITLERPVRITPEQAVRDYFGALSHHVPHFRRMWLLLSKAGRVSTAYGSYEGFKAYWADRLRKLKRGHAGTWTPLVFEIEDFKAEKSVGRLKIDGEFRLKVSVRGQRQAGAIHVLPMRLGLVRGPDKMWYLESGTLPQSASI
jgi:hypothetical protein